MVVVVVVVVRPITGEASGFSVILLSSPISANWFVALPCYYPLVLKHLLPSKNKVGLVMLMIAVITIMIIIMLSKGLSLKSLITPLLAQI